MSTVAPSPVTDFYVRLGEDEALLEEFERDPQASLEGAGFSADALAVLLEGDLDTIRATVRDETRNAPRSEWGGGEHTPDEGGEHTPDDDDDSGEHTPDDAPGEHTPDDDPGEHTPDDDDPGEHTPDE